MESKKILVVEDEGIIAMGIKKKMIALGYTVVGTAFTGEEAITIAGAQKPDLVLMDIKLAGKLDGIETAHRIREKFDIPVIYLTAFSDMETIRRAKITEPYGYIPKPVDEIDLKCNIEIALYRHQIKAELFRKKEMEAIGKFSVGITHDFNNLLQGIIGYVDVAASKCTTAGCESECLPLLNKSLQRLQKATDLIKQYQHIYNIYEYDMFRKNRISVPDIVKRIESAVDKIQEEKDIKILYRIEELSKQNVSLSGDADQLEEVFIHLITNAVEATAGKEEQVEIKIAIDNVPLEPENEWLLKPGFYMKISVTDQGVGIPAENLDKLFIPYFSTKEEYTQKGMGLGMTICYSIIKQHEGHIDIKSQEGRGTVVDILIPINDQSIGFVMK